MKKVKKFMKKSPAAMSAKRKLLKYNNDIKLSPEISKKLNKGKLSASRSKSGSIKRSKVLDKKMEQMFNYQMKEEKILTPTSYLSDE